MRKRIAVLPVLMVAGMSGRLPGQAIVEHSAASSASATAGAAMSRIGKRLNSALEQTGKGLEKAEKQPGTSKASSGSAAAAVARSSAPAAQSPAVQAPAKTYEDPIGIKTGMGYAELVRRFGQPATMITSEEGDQSMFYAGRDGGQVSVRVRNREVVSVN